MPVTDFSVLADILGMPNWLYFTLMFLILVGLIGGLVFMIKKRSED